MPIRQRPLKTDMHRQFQMGKRELHPRSVRPSIRVGHYRHSRPASRQKPATTPSPRTDATPSSTSGCAPGRYTSTTRRSGSISQANSAPLRNHSSIFACRSARRSLGERNSMTNSGQMGANVLCCSRSSAFQRDERIQEASGERIDQSERRNPVEELKTTPTSVSRAQACSW